MHFSLFFWRLWTQRSHKRKRRRRARTWSRLIKSERFLGLLNTLVDLLGAWTQTNDSFLSTWSRDLWTQGRHYDSLLQCASATFSFGLFLPLVLCGRAARWRERWSKANRNQRGRRLGLISSAELKRPRVLSTSKNSCPSTDAQNDECISRSCLRIMAQPEGLGICPGQGKTEARDGLGVSLVSPWDCDRTSLFPAPVLTDRH